MIPENTAPAAKPSVCVVLVTYNRQVLLRGCLLSLLRQSRLPDHILVVDNHSSDDTLQMLQAEFASNVQVPVTVLPQAVNSGGAGGFSVGMEWAHRQGFDWSWVMDDDIETLPGTLEMLLSYREVSEFIQCRRITPDGGVVLDSMWDISGCYAAQPRNGLMHVNSDRPWLAVQWGNFEGSLIHRSIVDRIGLPDARFFVGGDDSTYGLEASFLTNVIYLKEVGIERKRAAPKTRSRMVQYLWLRNRFLVREHMKKLGFQVHPLVFWTSQIVNFAYAVKSVLNDPEEVNKGQMIGAVWQGLVDGVRGRFGRPPFINA